MTDELITIPRALLEEALLNVAWELQPTLPISRRIVYATDFVKKAMDPLDEAAKAYARSDAGRHAAMVRHHGTQFLPTIPPALPAVAPQTAQIDAGAAISPAPLPSPVPKRGRPAKRAALEQQAAVAVAQQLAAPPQATAVPMGTPFSEPFTATPMPAAPFVPQPQPAPATVFVPAPIGAPGPTSPMPSHPFGVRPE